MADRSEHRRLTRQDLRARLNAFVAFYKPWMTAGRNVTWGWAGVLAITTAAIFVATRTGEGQWREPVTDALAAMAIFVSLQALGRTGSVFDRFTELVHTDSE